MTSNAMGTRNITRWVGSKQAAGGSFSAILFFLLTFSSTTLAQITIHVPADKPTIQAGIDAAQNGDTVLVAPGTYNENIDFKGKAITVTSGATSYAGAATTIIQAAQAGAVVTFDTNEPASAVFNGFTVQGAFSYATTTTDIAGIAVTGSSPTISNNIIQENVACGVVIDSGGSPTLQGDHIWLNRFPTGSDPLGAETCGPSNGMTPGTGIGIYYGGNITVRDSLIEENTARLDDYPSGGIFVNSTRSLTLVNNVVHNNGFYGTAALSALDSISNGSVGSFVLLQNLMDGTDLAAGDLGPPHPKLTLVNNTFVSGLALDPHYDPASLIENNIIYVAAPGNRALWCVNGPSPPNPMVVRKNDIFTVGGGPDGKCPVDSTNLLVDPQFLNFASGDYHTQRTSPVVAAGDITAPGIQPEDLDHRNRTVCGTIDMGAYEVHPQPPVTITSTPNPSVGGSSVFFTAKVTGNCNVPTGTLTFYDGATPLGTVPLDASASATFNTASLTVGSHNITARYPKDFNFDDSTSNTIVQVVTGYPTATTLQVSPNPAQAFQSITLSASVSSQFGTPTGTVSFLSGAKLLGTAPVNANGQAATTVNTLGAGSYNITAAYNATTQYAGSVSAAVVEIVVGTSSTTTLTSTPNPSAFGQTVTFTTNLATSGSTPTGTVTFLEGGTTLSSASVASSVVATFSTASLAAGSHTITAAYGGSANYNASTSNAVVQVVTPPPPPPDFTLLVNPTALDLGLKASGTTLVTVTPTSSGLGSVLLTCGPLPVAASCSFSPSTMSFSTTDAQTSTLTIHIAPSSAKNESFPARNSHAPLFLAGFLLAPGLFLGRLKRRRGLRNLCLAGLLMVGAMGMSSCGYTRYPISEIGYQIAVQATAQTLGTLKQQNVTVTAAR